MKMDGILGGVAVAVLFLCAGLAGEAIAQDSPTPGCSTALLVIDMQNAYVPARGLLTVDGTNLVDCLVSVLERARKANMPIVYIKQTESRFASGNPLGDIVAAIAPHEGEPVIWKPTGNAFYQTDLEGILATLGVHRVLIAGLATHGCVNETVFGALGLHYETWVIADAHGDASGPDLEAYYNANWPACGVHVVSSTEIDFSQFDCTGSAAPAGG